MGVTRREFLRTSIAAGMVLAATDTYAPTQFLSPQPAPQTEPKYFLKHSAFANPLTPDWRIDGFDQMSNQIDLELRMLQMPSDKVLFVERKSGEVLEEYEHVGARRKEWEMKSPDRARSYTLGISSRMEDDVERSHGLKKGEIIGRVGYSDVLAEGLERIAPWAGYLQQIAQCNGLDPMMPIILALQETNWSPRLVSNKDCSGVFQLNEKNSRDYGLYVPENLSRLQVNENFQPLTQAFAAMPFFKTRIPLAGNSVLATSFYHAGENNVLKMLAIAVHIDPALAERPMDAFDWVLGNYDNILNTGGYSGFGYFSSRYPLRVLAMKHAAVLPLVADEQLIRADRVTARQGMRVHDLLKTYFNLDGESTIASEEKELFRKLNPHMPVRNGRILNTTLPAGVDIYLPLGEGNRYVKQYDGAVVRFDGTIDPLPQCDPWLEIDDLYGSVASARAERIDAVPEDTINALYHEAKQLAADHSTPFRNHQRLALAMDRGLYCEEGRRFYAAAARGDALPMTKRQQELAKERSTRKRRA